MHGATAGQATPDDLRDVRQQRRRDAGEDLQHRVQGVEGLRVRLLALPEPVAGAAHVPVGQGVGEAANLVAGIGDAGVCKRGIDSCDHVVRLGQDVAVEHVGGVQRPGRLVRAVELQERVRVPDWQERLAHAVADALLGDDEVAAAQDGAGHEEPAHRVRTVTVKDLVDVRVVALGLGHLQAVVAEHDAVGDDLLKRRAVEQRGGHHVLEVEPAASLAGVLHDEVGRLAGFKLLHVFKRVVVLGERHRAGLEPAVQHVRHAAHHGLARRIVRVGAHQLVDVRAVQRFGASAEVALELVEGAVHVDARVLRVVRHPRRHRGAPVAGTRDVPVARALQPLAKLAVADVRRDPVDLLVQFNHAVAELGDLDKPCRQRHVDERLAGAPGVRVGVDDGLVAHHAARSLELADDVAVRVKHQLALVLGDEAGELAVGVDRDDQVDVVLFGGEHIVLTKGGRLVDHTGTVFGGDVVRQQDHERVLRALEVIEDRLVLQPLQLRATEGGNDLRVRAQLLGVGAHEVGGQQQLRSGEALDTVLGNADQRVLHLRVDRQGQVGREGPGGGGPGDRGGVVKLRVLLPRGCGGKALAATGERHGHRHRGVLALAVGIVQTGLLVGQRRVLRPRVRQDAEALVDQALVVELLERPHDGLHELRVHRLVAVFKVDPTSLTRDVVFPLVRVVHDGLCAVLVEALEAHVLDLRFVLDAQLLLCLQLGGQAVAVPAEHARHVVAGHRAVARDDVLDVAGEQVAVVRQAVGKGRAVIEHVLFGDFTVFQRGLKGPVAVPVVQHDPFHVREPAAATSHVYLGVDATYLGHHSSTHVAVLVQGRGKPRGTTLLEANRRAGSRFICGEGSDVSPCSRPVLLAAALEPRGSSENAPR